MLKITIQNPDTGETIVREGNFCMLHVAEEHGAGTLTQGCKGADLLDVLRCLMGHDFIREKMFNDIPSLKLAYTMREILTTYGGAIDLEELERQAKGGQS